ncbi:MAG: S-adenosylmethionine:tRNA ribosyltransferase-isomerase, partial [Rhodospirillaceae bacterium]|nr:S-adenosylmethionine:tRNA ribosyltransferase-isomerase [Rhodospirillaceae bacterium]
MRLDDFDFALPRDRIAQQPASPRDTAKLLVVEDGISDRQVLDLPVVLQPGDMLVVNETKVIPVRLSGRRGDVAISVTLHTDLGDGRWLAFAKPGRRLREGDRVVFADNFSASVGEKTPNGDVTLDFEC